MKKVATNLFEKSKNKNNSEFTAVTTDAPSIVHELTETLKTLKFGYHENAIGRPWGRP